MSDLVLRLLERSHGHLGWLAVASLFHPALLLRRRGRRAVVSVCVATSLTTLAAAMGAGIYPSYRRVLKHSLFVEHPSVAWWFERKEHLAVGVVTFAWIGLVAHLGATRCRGQSQSLLICESIAHRAYVIAALLSIVVAVVGVITSATATF
jgi:hypothetical protein